MDFAVHSAFLALDENDESRPRCLLTLYPGDENGYIGFFESEDSPDAAQLVPDAAAERARSSDAAGYMSARTTPRSGSPGPLQDLELLHVCSRASRRTGPSIPASWEQCGFRVTEPLFFQSHAR